MRLLSECLKLGRRISRIWTQLVGTHDFRLSLFIVGYWLCQCECVCKVLCEESQGTTVAYEYWRKPSGVGIIWRDLEGSVGAGWSWETENPRMCVNFRWYLKGEIDYRTGTKPEESGSCIKARVGRILNVSQRINFTALNSLAGILHIKLTREISERKAYNFYWYWSE